MADLLPPPIGRIRLSEIADDWSQTQALNPRLLASEVAGVLRTIAPQGHPLERQHYSLTVFDASTGAGDLSYSTLSEYFECLSVGISSANISTTTGLIPSGAVILTRTFIERIVNEATGRAATAAGFIIETLPPPSSKSGALRRTNQPETITGSSPKGLSAHEAQQRQDGERSALERLDAAEQKALQLENENVILRAKLGLAETRRQQAEEDAQMHRLAAKDELRKRTLAEDQLREHEGIIAFMDESNALSPVEGRRVVAAWCEMTDNGRTDPTADTGVGVGALAERWWQSNFGTPAGIIIKHLQWAITWPARKKGGVVAKKPSKKGVTG